MGHFCSTIYPHVVHTPCSSCTLNHACSVVAVFWLYAQLCPNKIEPHYIFLAAFYYSDQCQKFCRTPFKCTNINILQEWWVEYVSGYWRDRRWRGEPGDLGHGLVWGSEECSQTRGECNTCAEYTTFIFHELSNRKRGSTAHLDADLRNREEKEKWMTRREQPIATFLTWREKGKKQGQRRLFKQPHFAHHKKNYTNDKLNMSGVCLNCSDQNPFLQPGLKQNKKKVPYIHYNYMFSLL